MKTESMKGGLWLTGMGRITLDNQNNEVFQQPPDIKLMTAKELKDGIKVEELLKRMLHKR